MADKRGLARDFAALDASKPQAVPELKLSSNTLVRPTFVAPPPVPVAAASGGAGQDTTSSGWSGKPTKV